MSAETTAKGPVRYDAGPQVAQEDFICLHRNENLFATRMWDADRVAEILREVSLPTYPDPGYMGLRSDIAELYGVEPENVFLGNGSDEVLADLLAMQRRSYDTVHFLDACFRVYLMLAARLDYRVAVLPGRTFETGRIEPDGRPGLAVVDSPNAITSRSATTAELRGLAAPEGSFLIWDNAYGEFAREGLLIPWADNVVLVRSFSKFYALAGARIGYCIAHRDLVADLMDHKDVFNVNALGQALARAALRRRDEFLELVEEATACRAVLLGYLEEMGFSVHPPSANYVLATHRELPGAAIQAALHEEGIAVRRFEGPLTGNSIRITVAPRPILEILSERLSRVLRVL
jgi:histidinol-phosphate aminotransferase